jgi:hypothetical protein
LNEHPAGRGTTLSHSVKEVSYRTGAICILLAISLIANRLIDLHALPVGVKFVRKHEWQGSADGRSHLRPVGHDVDSSIALNSYEEIGMKGGAVSIGLIEDLTIGRQSLRQNRWDETYGEHKRARSKSSLEESTPTNILDLSHAILPAASLIAWRIRW